MGWSGDGDGEKGSMGTRAISPEPRVAPAVTATDETGAGAGDEPDDGFEKENPPLGGFATPGEPTEKLDPDPEPPPCLGYGAGAAAGGNLNDTGEAAVAAAPPAGPPNEKGDGLSLPPPVLLDELPPEPKFRPSRLNDMEDVGTVWRLE